MKLLTEREKDAIRNSPCGVCHAIPPFADGSRCHTHRIIPDSKGGLYTKENTVPRCPDCHANEPEHSPMLRVAGKDHRGKHPSPEHCAAISAGLKGRHHPCSPETRAKLSVSVHASMTPERRAKISTTMRGRHLSPKHCAAISAVQRGKRHSPERCAAESAAQRGKHVAERRLHIRWHVRRGIVNLRCAYCCETAVLAVAQTEK
jgi:HNH endonuclease/NUMOD3 motif